MLGLAILLLTALAMLMAILTAMAARELRRPPRRTTAYAIAHGLACDPGDTGFEFDAWTLDLPDGARLPVWEIVHRHENTTGTDAPPLAAVVVHGWGESRIDSLARRDEWWELFDRIILYDLRGHGEALPGNGSSRLGQGEESDLSVLLERLGEARLVMVGWGMGAAIAFAAAHSTRTVRERVAAVVAVEPVHDVKQQLMDHLAAQGLPPRPVGAFAIRWLAMIGCRPVEFPETAPVSAPPIVVLEAGRANEGIVRLADSLRAPEATHAPGLDSHAAE